MWRRKQHRLCPVVHSLLTHQVDNISVNLDTLICLPP